MELLDNSVETIKAFEQLDVDKKFIFGTGIYSQAALQVMEFNSFVEENPTQTSIMGKPICSLESIPRDIVLLVGSSLYPFSASTKLKKAGFIPLHLLYYLQKHKSKRLYFAEFESHFEKNKEAYGLLDKSLEDKQSRDLLKGVIDFRLTADINLLWGLKSPGEHYFEEFINLGSDETFFDIGAYDGANSLRFSEITNESGSIVMFEANPMQQASLKTLLRNGNNMQLISGALSDKDTHLYFDSNKGSSSRIQSQETESSIMVKAKRLDSLNLNCVPTFMKLDVEGAEMRVLNGATETIRKFRPRLAISVYHRPKDILEAFVFCQRNLQGARYFLRQYTEGTDEIVLYSLPN
jgi:FkbM family methyltransferase